jgi:uncharacterized protein (DUF2252 family)
MGAAMTATTTRRNRPAATRPATKRPDRRPAAKPNAPDVPSKDTGTPLPLESLAATGPERGRDPIGLLLGQAESRVPELVPIRHGRMLTSPFSYYRGAALPMVADLAAAPSSGLRVQLCGDAHLSNFGAFASPERRLVFDVNDFDETLPGPFEWDVKRLAASFAVAARQNGFTAGAQRRILVKVGQAYREAMLTFAQQTSLQVWYARLDIDDYLDEYRTQIKAKGFKAAKALLAKAQTNDSTRALGKLTEVVDGRMRIISDPPTVVAVEQLFSDVDAGMLYALIRNVLSKYRRSLQTDRQHLLEDFDLVQVARKVVGVGSVGTRAWIVFMDSKRGNEPLFLQAKEAQPSVLADYADKSRFHNEGERVVAGQRLMQAQSDIFLGWTKVTGPDGVGRDFYVRQLRDWKASIPIEQMRPPGMIMYAHLCGWTLARAHARSGDRIALAAYLGGSAGFDEAIADFANAYADRNDSDYAAFQTAAAKGRIQATPGV